MDLVHSPTSNGLARTSSLFDRLFSDLAPTASSKNSTAIDVYEEDGDVYLEAELPGMSRDDVELTYENGALNIHGEYSDQNEEWDEDRNWHVRQRTYQSFNRTIPLNDDIDPDDISAQMDNGVLTTVIEGASRQTENDRTTIDIK